MIMFIKIKKSDVRKKIIQKQKQFCARTVSSKKKIWFYFNAMNKLLFLLLFGERHLDRASNF